jgi:hypothetical protein
VGIVRTDEDDWFDPILEHDTSLFVDPFLISQDYDPWWRNEYGHLVEFFNHVLQLVAKSGDVRTSAHWRKAEALLKFHEPAEFALGYGKSTIFGSGTGKELGAAMLEAATEAVHYGIEEVDNLEELVLLGPSVGPDRIGDLVCDVLKESFIRYTLDIAESHSVPLESVPVENAKWDRENLRWVPTQMQLPRNTVWDRRIGVLLTPERFLRHLPTVSAEGFWDWAWGEYGETLRLDFNYHLGQAVDRREIARLVRTNRGMWQRYLESRDLKPYDFVRDPKGHIVKYDGPREAAYLIAPPPVPKGPDEFCDFVKDVVAGFKWCVEERDSWKMLWDGEFPRNEKMCQLLFFSTVTLVCKARDVDLSKEPQTGRGTVDFKFSTGWERRALVEFKLAKSSSLKPNTTFQMPQYLKSDDVNCGVLVVIQFTDTDRSTESVEWVTRECGRISRETGKRYEPVFVDAGRDNKPSASIQR